METSTAQTEIKATEKTETVDLAGLRKLYQSNADAKLILDHFAGFQRNRGVTLLERTENALNRGGRKVAKGDIIAVFRELEDLGVGIFIVGRKSRATRFEWAYPLSAVGQFAAGKIDALPEPEVESEDDEDEEPTPAKPMPAVKTASVRLPHVPLSNDGGISVHPVRTKTHVMMLVELPASTSDKQVSRIAEFLKAVPF